MNLNLSSVFRIIGIVLAVISLSMLPSFIVSLIYDSSDVYSPFFIIMALCFFAGVSLMKLCSHKARKLKVRDGFLIVTICWLLSAAIGALPFIVTGSISDPVDAFFESCSGFSTTGSTILEDIEILPRGILFWRSFTHWIGGMGILVFAIALMPSLGISGQNVAVSEAPGPSLDKITPKMSDTAKSLYIIYLIFTVVETILLMLGAATTVEDMRRSELLLRRFPRLRQHLKLVSSTPIRNMATVAGNFVNASPIGDLTIFFLALDAQLTLQNAAGQTRQLPLRELYRGYKQLNRQPNEQLVEISFRPPAADEVFNFEKVSKRTHLDIASVNAAARLRVLDGVIQAAHLSAGGVGPTPLYLRRTSEWLAGQPLSPDTLRAAGELAQQEISPISDARGTQEYKRLLLRQLLYAHFLEHFPQQLTLAELL